MTASQEPYDQESAGAAPNGGEPPDRSWANRRKGGGGASGCGRLRAKALEMQRSSREALERERAHVTRLPCSVQRSCLGSGIPED